MCPDPTKGKFILNSQLNFTSTPLSLMPLLLMPQLQWLDITCCCRVTHRDLMFSDDLWCDVPWCHDPLMSPPSRDYRCQDPGPRTHLSLSPVYPPTRSLSTDARPEVWCGLVTQCHHESAQSNERYIQVSISPIFIFCLNNILPSPSFHVAVERDNKRSSFCSRDNETRTHSD